MKAPMFVQGFGNAPPNVFKVLAMLDPPVYKAGNSNFLLPLPNLAKSMLHNFSLNNLLFTICKVLSILFPP